MGSDVVNLPQVRGSATLADQLYEVLEQAIIDGTLTPGERLQADGLATHFGVSRIPVRETLRTLDANGWVEIRPRQGAYVRERSEEELRDLFEVRRVLEVAAARLAVEQRTDQQLDRLRRLVDEGRAAVDAGDTREVARINTVFHCLMGECTGNTVLADLLVGLGKRVQWYFSTVGAERGWHSMAEHAQMVDALARRDTAAAERLAAEHVDTTRDAVRAALSAAVEV